MSQWEKIAFSGLIYNFSVTGENIDLRLFIYVMNFQILSGKVQGR